MFFIMGNAGYLSSTVVQGAELTASGSGFRDGVVPVAMVVWHFLKACTNIYGR